MEGTGGAEPNALAEGTFGPLLDGLSDLHEEDGHVAESAPFLIFFVGGPCDSLFLVITSRVWNWPALSPTPDGMSWRSIPGRHWESTCSNAGGCGPHVRATSRKCSPILPSKPLSSLARRPFD